MLWTCDGELLRFAHCSNWRSSMLVKHWSSFSRQYRIYLSTVQICVHQWLPLPRKHSPDGTKPDWDCSLLLIYLPQKDGRLTQRGWLTYSYSRQFTHLTIPPYLWHHPSQQQKVCHPSRMPPLSSVCISLGQRQRSKTSVLVSRSLMYL